MSHSALLEHFFRHEYGRLVAMLVRRVGAEHLESVEDAVQSAMMSAVETWPASQPPANPSAWLYRVAHHALLDDLRTRSRRTGLIDRVQVEEIAAHETTAPTPSDSDASLLRMLFVCCDDGLPVESRVVLALKIACGFSIREIAVRLLATESAVQKRYQRACSAWRSRPPRVDLTEAQARPRIDAVRQVLYLLFTEGHLSLHPASALRRELCEEAVRLTHLLVSHPIGQSPEDFALLALMYLHLARFPARSDGAGGVILLEDQDRTRWDRDAIASGLSWLERSATGAVFSRYHAEAGIAAEHCLAPSLKETRWDRVAAAYELLQAAAPSPIHAMNHALAIAELRGPAAGLDLLRAIDAPPSLEASCTWLAVWSDLQRRCGHLMEARATGARAIAAAPTAAVRASLQRRLALADVTPTASPSPNEILPPP